MVKKDTKWWNEEVKTITKKKKTCYLALAKCKNQEYITQYKEIKTKIKAAVHEAKLKTFKKELEKISIRWQRGDKKILMT